MLKLYFKVQKWEVSYILERKIFDVLENVT